MRQLVRLQHRKYNDSIRRIRRRDTSANRSIQSRASSSASFQFFNPSWRTFDGLGIEHHRRLSSSNTRSLLFAALEDEDISSTEEKKQADDAEVPSTKVSVDKVKETYQPYANNCSEHMFSSKNTPLWHLKDYFLITYDIRIPNGAFKSEMVKYRKRNDGGVSTCWTSVFTSPLDGREFPSGTFSDSSSKQPLQHKNLPSDKVVYTKRSDADHAAASRVLDFIQFQKTGRLDPRYCVETPDAPLMNFAKALRLYYKREHEIKLKRGHRDYEVTEISIAEEGTKKSDETSKAYTAVFTCPVTKNTYTGWAAAVEKAPVATVDGLAYYARQSQAVQAAAARALEEYVGLDLKSHVNLKVHVETEGISTVVGSVKTPLDDSKHSPFEQQLHPTISVSPNVANNEVVDEYSSESLTDDDDAIQVDINANQVTEVDDEVFTNFAVEEFFGAAPAHSLLALATHSKSSSSLVSYDSAIEMSESFALRSGPRFHSPHRLSVGQKESSNLFLRGKACLVALSKSVQTRPFGKCMEARGVASSVLDRMWNSNYAKPDSDAYSLYMKCFDSPDPRETKERAELLLTSMKLRKSYKRSFDKLPPPGRGTMNTVIQLSSQIGGTRGRYATHVDDDNFVPNRDSFLSILSSAIYNAKEDGDTGGFDPEFASDCIERMSELYEETDDEALKPDVEVYNAPLRWTGGPVLWDQSRPYARIVPWDDYLVLYRNSFRETAPHDDIRMKQAAMVQEWMKKMEKLGEKDPSVSPNIETYEAVIQAWLRTATREGLLKAESILEEIISEKAGERGIQPRLQTFHPLLAARLYFIDPESKSKLLETLEVWYSFAAKRGIHHDFRLVEVELFTIWNTYGRKKLDDKNEKRFEVHTSPKEKQSPDQIKQEMLSAAVKASEVVSKIQESTAAQEGLFVPEMNLLELSLRMWRSVVTTDDDEIVEKAISEIEKALVRIENIMLGGHKRNRNTPMQYLPWGRGISQEVEHCVRRSHIVFFCSVHILSIVCKLRPHDRPRSFLLIEKMLRLVGEMEAIEATCVAEFGGRLNKSSASLDDDDMFKYELKSKAIESMARAQLLRPILNLIHDQDELSSLQGNSDALRICRISRDIWPDHPRRKELDKVLDKLSPEWFSRVEAEAFANTDNANRGDEYVREPRNAKTKPGRSGRRRRK